MLRQKMAMFKTPACSKSILVHTVLWAAGIFAVQQLLAPTSAKAADATASKLEYEIGLSASLGKIKDLQYTYAEYAQFGLWDEMAALFADDASIVIGERTIRGRPAIRAYLGQFGDGGAGLKPGSLNTELYMAPVVTLSTDGEHATGRWQNLNMRGKVGGEARWSGGFIVNSYVRENGVWKIARMDVHQQFSGSYEKGWFADGGVIPFLPYHYTSNEAGAPIPAAATAIGNALTDAALAPEAVTALKLRAGRMIDEDRVRNLQNQYGYYADRKMWDDVADLFAPDAALEIAGVGIYNGVRSIRRGLEKDGPVNLQRGQVNDQVQLHVVVEVAPNGVEARARGLQLGMLSPKLGEAHWMISNFVSRYEKVGGKWRILEMRVFPKMKADYYQGWHKSNLVDPVPAGKLMPDRRSGPEMSPQTSAVIPALSKNPVSGESVAYPAGFGVVGQQDLVKRKLAKQPIPTTASTAETMAETRRLLNVVRAYDAIENASSTFGYYLDDYQWQRYVENYSDDGWRRKGGGEIYIGRTSIFKAEAASYGPSPTTVRDWIRVHTRLQPVIDISEDATTAFIRTRMLLYFANSRAAGAFNSGMYPNDSAKLENGVWKMKIGGWIDETYFSSRNYALGWAKPGEGGRRSQDGRGVPEAAASEELAQARQSFRYPPDIPSDKLGRRGFGVVAGQPGFASWPDIKPMWFHYVNPVSGRKPELLCADVTVCVKEQ